jgi:hypothetical protein
MGPDANDETRVTNGANLTHSNLYGFGVVDASAAVEAAKTWDLYTPERLLVGESGMLNISLLDDPSSPVSSTISIEPTSEDYFVEAVEIYIALNHFSRGDLEIILTSPQGTESILHPGQRPENTVLYEDERWKLLTVRSWGESAKGDWTLEIRDISAGDALVCADAPFSVESGNIILTCDYTEATGLCADGAVDESSLTAAQVSWLRSVEDHEKNVEEACCVCGGGMSTDDFDDSLQEWRLVVYGREFPYDASISMAPSEAPSMVSSGITRGVDPGTLTRPPTPASPGGDTIPTSSPSEEDPNDGGGFRYWSCSSALLIPVLVILLS